ncbi:pseudouridine synthase [Vagococcus vulneris]|uniref:Pseudouridine synthase n=1 Tax=Vagococcus vulneris TaxID=1977869 RepID=A0A429ZS38_9ENTE|nr:pseudouridine synthase [Vagococcus vulneris]RST96554.1 16S rRNA pseudouridine(516) synthase [Vagococcus vulneris]
MRLDKFLSHTGFGSRKEVKSLLKKKLISVNDQIVKEGKKIIDETSDQIKVSGQLVLYQKYFYYMLNKPQGVVSATEDSEHRTVIDLLADKDKTLGLFPVGRLDKDTTGLLLLTNDGELAHQLLSPKKKVAKIYRAQIAGIMTEADIMSFADGVTLKDGYTCLPAELVILSVDDISQQSLVDISILEGKYHQVKRMVAAVDKKVLSLDRLSMGGLVLDSTLEKGAYRCLTADEMLTIKRI